MIFAQKPYFFLQMSGYNEAILAAKSPSDQLSGHQFSQILKKNWWIFVHL
jgi:hypothetical protein